MQKIQKKKQEAQRAGRNNLKDTSTGALDSKDIENSYYKPPPSSPIMSSNKNSYESEKESAESDDSNDSYEKKFENTRTGPIENLRNAHESHQKLFDNIFKHYRR